MKKLSDLLEEGKTIYEADDKKEIRKSLLGLSSVNDKQGTLLNGPPPVLIFKRENIRNIGDGKGVALYYSSAISKHILIPYGFDTLNISEEEENQEKEVLSLDEKFVKNLENIREQVVLDEMFGSIASAAVKYAAGKAMGALGSVAAGALKGVANGISSLAKSNSNSTSSESNPNLIRAKNNPVNKTKGTSSYDISRIKAASPLSSKKQVAENRISSLKKLSESEIPSLRIGKYDIEKELSKKAMYIYENLNASNKKIFENLLNGKDSDIRNLFTFINNH